MKTTKNSDNAWNQLQIRQCFCEENVHLEVPTSRIQRSQSWWHPNSSQHLSVRYLCHHLHLNNTSMTRHYINSTCRKKIK